MLVLSISVFFQAELCNGQKRVPSVNPLPSVNPIPRVPPMTLPQGPPGTQGTGQVQKPSYPSAAPTQEKSLAPIQDKKLLFDRLSDTDKVKYFMSLSDADKVLLFFTLYQAEQAKLLATMGEAEAANFFLKLTDADKARFISGLSDTDKPKYFMNLSDLSKESLFQLLDDRTRKVILDSLTEEEKARWLAKYPYLAGISVAKGIPSPPTPAVLAPPVTERVPSDIERILSGQFPDDISRDLQQFGYAFFERDMPAFTPLTNVPVGLDYVIGPGDSFLINVWGRAEGAYPVTVAREGTITLPQIGTMSVNGLTFGDLKKYLYNRVKQFHPDFELNVTMTALRTIDVFLVGEVNAPGTYTISSLSTVITALSAAGGPTKRGSLRKVQVTRNGKTVKVLDVYDFLVRGDKKNDIRLQPGDTVFVPVIGPVAGVAGCVKRPAIYEIMGSETIEDIVDLAGGILPVGYSQNVLVERVKGNERRVVTSISLESGTQDRSLKALVKDFDLIKVYPVHKRVHQVVYLEGHVKYPREYELKPGMKLRDLIQSDDDLLPEPYLPQAEIIRLMPPDKHPEIVQFGLGGLLAGDERQNLNLQDMDRVIVYDKWTKDDYPAVTVNGAVRSPGTYRLYDGMRVKDLIFQAGNLKDIAYQEAATLTRVVIAEKGTDSRSFDFSLRRAMADSPVDNLLLQKNDTIHVREIPRYAQVLERKVVLEGEFIFPGEYSFQEGERLVSVIQSAGGLTREAYAFGAVFQRESVRVLQEEQMKNYLSKLEEDVLTMTAQGATTATDPSEAAIFLQTLTAKRQLIDKLKAAKPTGRMVIDLPRALENPSSEFNLRLRPGDRLIIAQRSDMVNVLGEVYNPTALAFEEGKTVDFYLNMVGGPTESAEDGQIYVVKANGSVFSKAQSSFFGSVSWDSDSKRWTAGRSFGSAALDPGDTVIVPKKIEEYPWLRIVKDITQIAYQIAVAAGVILVAF
jgi:protein involved in polysaccharide export with SLBB domain